MTSSDLPVTESSAASTRLFSAVTRRLVARTSATRLLAQLVVTAVLSGLLAVAAATPARALVMADLELPGLGMTKAADDEVVEAGQTVHYTLGLPNTGTAPAEDARVWDVLPSGITCLEISAVSDGGSCAGGRITWTGVDVAVGATKSLTYTLTVPIDVSPGVTYTNRAGVVEYAYTGDDGTSLQLVPDNPVVKDPALPAPNMPAAEASEEIRTPSAALVMGRTTSVNEPGNNAGSQATVGEKVTYTVVATLPRNTTVYDAALTDALGPRQSLVPGSLCVNGCTLDGVAFSGVSESPANTVLAAMPRTYKPTNADGVLVMTFQVTILDVAANARSSLLGSTVTLTYTDQDGQLHTRSGSVSTTLVEPKIAVAKAHAGSSVVAAAEVKAFTVTVSASSGTNMATAHGVTIVDTLPVGTDPVSINGGGVWDAAARTITWTVASIAPGASVPRTYSVQVESPPTGGTRYTNTVAATARSLDAILGARTSASTAPTAGDYAASALSVVSVVPPTVTTTADPATATVGSHVTWTVRVEIPAGIRHFDTTVVDTVPDGLAVDGYGAMTCTAGCRDADPAVGTFPVTTSGATQQAAWFLGDLGAAPENRTYELVLNGHVLATRRVGGMVTAPVSFTNSVRVRTNRTDTLPVDPGAVPASYSDSAGPASASTAVREPALTLDTSADRGPRVEGGDLVTYTVAVTNTGSWPAYDVVVTDLPDSELVDVALVDGASFSTDGWSADDPQLRWMVPGPLAAGASQVLTYTARVRSGAELTAGAQVTNAAAVPSYHGATTAERVGAAGNLWREYAGPSDTVTLTVVKPALTIVKTPDDGVTTAGADATFTITVENTSAHATAHDVELSDVLPAGLTYVSSSPSGTASGQSVGWTVGALAPGGAVTITLVARVGSDVAAGSILTNTASTHAAEVPAYTYDTGSLVVVAAPTITGPDTATGTVGQPFTWSPTTTGNPTPTLTVSGTVPPGTGFDSTTGVVSGSSTAAGTYTFTVTATNSAGTASRTVTATIDSAFSGLAPSISGTADVGQTVTSSPGASFAPSGPPTHLDHQWERSAGGAWAPIADATSATYEVTPADEGFQLRVQVTATRSSYTTATQLSGASSVVGKGSFTISPPIITGPAVVGGTLTCAAPSGPGTASYAWTGAGSTVGPAGDTYEVRPADLATRVSCEVTVERPGYVDATSSAESDVVALGTFAVGMPMLDSDPVVGRRTTCFAARETPGTVTFGWSRSGVDLATGDTYTPTMADLGAALTCTVTASPTGYTAATAAVTSPIVVPAPARSWKASVSGRATVGRTLRAALSPIASALTVRWQWAVDGRPVPAATGPTYTVRPTDRGKRVSVAAVVVEPGHVDARVVSALTRQVTLGQLRFALSTSRLVRGRKFSFTASELAPRQAWVLRFASGRVLARGRATAAGTVAWKLRVPSDARRGERYVVLVTRAPERIRRLGITIRRSRPARRAGDGRVGR